MSGAGDKLARTRLAIIEHVYRREHGREARDRDSQAAQTAAHDEYDDARRRGAGWFASVKRAAGTWWRHHPAHMGLEVASPMLSAYAARRPVTYLAGAAALGAVIVLTRPWRLISITGLLVALIKSSQLSSMVMSAVSAANYDGEPPPYR